MKTFFILFATVLFVFGASAQKTESATLSIAIGKTKDHFKFATYAELNSKADIALDEAISVYKGAISQSAVCQAMVTVTVTVSDGLLWVSLSGTVTAICSEIHEAAKRLREQLYAAAMASIGS